MLFRSLGDELMFCSLINELLGFSALNSTSLTLQVDARLKSLMSRSFPTINVISHDETPEGVDAQLALGSIPKLLRSDLASFYSTGRNGYLTADSSRRDALKTRLANKKNVVGISWKTLNPNDSGSRTIPISQMAEFIGTTAQIGRAHV